MGFGSGMKAGPSNPHAYQLTSIVGFPCPVTSMRNVSGRTRLGGASANRSSLLAAFQ